MKTWVVYVHISPSGKRYVGITSQNPPEKRWQNGYGYKVQQYFWRAIEKYGWDNFEHIIYAKNLSETEAKELEKKLIAEYSSNQKEYGYNLTAGGDGTVGYVLEQRHIDALKAANSIPIYQFDKNYNFIREFGSIRDAGRYYDVSKSSIRDCCSMELNIAYGYIWRYKKDVSNPYDKDCIPKFNLRKNNRAIYKINIYTREYILYNNIMEACNIENLIYSYIYNCCNKKNGSQFYNNCLWVYVDDVNDIESYVKNNSNFIVGHRKSVEQYDLNGNLIKWFKSMSEAAKELSINRKSIALACNGKLENYGGFIWEYS